MIVTLQASSSYVPFGSFAVIQVDLGRTLTLFAQSLDPRGGITRAFDPGSCTAARSRSAIPGDRDRDREPEQR